MDSVYPHIGYRILNEDHSADGVKKASQSELRSMAERWIPEMFHDNRGECATAEEGAAKIFPEELAKTIEDGDYSADQIFNADETGLYWKKLPKDEKIASGHKASKDRVTLLLCSNASGDRMLKPLLKNKSLRPRALKGKDLKHLSVHWMANLKAWMTTAIFTEWFKNCFVPEVEAYMKEKSLDFKVLLIVDNAASHPQLEHPKCSTSISSAQYNTPYSAKAELQLLKNIILRQRANSS
ncbi:tigger transposable element-derived protein 1 [Trichonephila clavipes]|nr:tigger transposable element-derived protein 1 [Trichonephila clavipes]